jgi:cell division protein FtsB
MRAARAAAWSVAAVVVVVVLAVFVFPTRTYLGQRRQLSLTARELQVLDAQNAQLSAEAAKLRTDGEIEHIARAQYHLVRPGEQAFAILPPPSPAPAPPVSRPHRRGGWWHALTSWL